LLSPFTRALAYYLGGGFALALFCALLFFDRPPEADGDSQRRLRRRALVLSSVGLLHPMVALTAFGLARDATRVSDSEAAKSTLIAAATSLIASLAVATGVLISAA
jgi:hypothetical protein